MVCSVEKYASVVQMMSTQIEVGRCPPSFVDYLLLEPCLFLGILPVVSSCEISGDSVSVKFSKPVDHVCEYKLWQEPRGWKIELRKGPEPRASAYLEWLRLYYLGGAFFKLEYEVAGGFFAKRELAKVYSTLFSNYTALAEGRCRKVDIAERLRPPRAPRVEVEEKPFWESLPVDIKVDLSLALVRAQYLREVELVHASDGLPKANYLASKVRSGEWMIVVVYPNGREYLLLSNGVIVGRYLEGVKGTVVQSVFYKLRTPK
ncbi:hypothetical protein WLZ34_06555 [Thermogladius sp. KZ2Tp1]|uniref:hypothetical protein n=1 Tax=Thermogladius sp. KZ2Tp1 TaxID=3136289 RepID=UPI003DA7C01C